MWERGSADRHLANSNYALQAIQTFADHVRTRVRSDGNDAAQKPRGRVWPGLKSVGGDIQPQLVTVLTPATSTVTPHSIHDSQFVNADAEPYVLKDCKIFCSAPGLRGLEEWIAARVGSSKKTSYSSLNLTVLEILVKNFPHNFHTNFEYRRRVIETDSIWFFDPIQILPVKVRYVSKS